MAGFLSSAYLAAIAVFCDEVKGKSALALSRDLGLSYKSAYRHGDIEPGRTHRNENFEPNR
ncbi:hypothetical protein V1282_005626 [Nitrobacteraceae bacterium AZCC 2146]